MSRAERLLNLIETFRRHRRPVTGEALAAATGVSLRTLYRDIDSLRAMGAGIEGEAGIGYILKPGFILPPIMFQDDEIDALVLGARWVAERADPHLAQAARNALARLSAALPTDMLGRIDKAYHVVGSFQDTAQDSFDIRIVRQAIKAEHRLKLTYADGKDTQTLRMIWPFLIGYFDGVRLISAWCELRQAIRHFRSDRVVKIETTGQRYPTRRLELLALWKKTDPTVNENC
jgi:predicted DNA-binding transcriptional regulator YafY